MNRFVFRLANLLRLRGVEEDRKKQELGSAMGHFVNEENKLKELDGTLSEHEKLMKEKGAGTVSARELQNNFNYTRSLDGRIDEQQKNVKKSEDAVNVKRAELAEASKHKKILERLKDRDREEHNRAAGMEEQASIDEMATQRNFKTR